MSLPPQLREEDYETIAAAVMETARGRWFLNEYARRNRAADTCSVLEAVAKLEKTLVSETPKPTHQINSALEKLQADLQTLGSGKTIQQVLAVAEDIQETAWALRELGANPDFCEKLDRNAADLRTACAQQEAHGQHISRLAQSLGFSETATPQEDADDVPGQQDVYDIFNAAQIADTPALIDEAHIMAPQHYTQRETKITALPKSSLPHLQATLASAWAVPEEEEDNANAGNSPPASFHLSDYSFEEKLALFS